MLNQQNVKTNGNIFAEVQDRYTVKEIAESLGIRLHKVGSDERANSIFGNATTCYSDIVTQKL